MDVTSENGLSQWYAIRVRSRFERTVSDILRSKEHEVFLPLYVSRRKWSDRVKTLELPLFPGYVFCRFNPAARFPVVSTAGVVCIVGFGDHLVPVNPDEIDALRAVSRSGLQAAPAPYMRVGQRAYIEAGPLAGLEGIVVENRGSFRLVLSVSLLQRSVTVEIDREWARATAEPRKMAVAANAR